MWDRGVSGFIARVGKEQKDTCAGGEAEWTSIDFWLRSKAKGAKGEEGKKGREGWGSLVVRESGGGSVLL